MNVLIAGVGLHPFGRFPLAVEELGRAAAIEALADAGVSYPDVDLTVVANVGEGMAKGQRIAERLGATGRPVLSVESACASGAALSQAPVTWTPGSTAAHTSAADTRPPRAAACSATNPQTRPRRRI